MNADINSRIRDALQYIPTGPHEERFRMACMIKSELGDNGRDLWDFWRDGRGDDEAASVWRSTSETGALKIGTLFHDAKINGWRDDSNYQPPSPQWLAERKRLNEASAEKEKAETDRMRATAAKNAAALWKAGTDPADNPYLKRKDVLPTPTLKQIDAAAATAILGYPPKSKGQTLLTGMLLVAPIRQGGTFSTVELIDEARHKAALTGRGTKTGGYWASEPLPKGNGAGLTLMIGEGVATGLTAKKAKEHPVVAAFSAGNLPAVAKQMRETYPAAVLIFLADLVKKTGEPDPHAVAAARAVNGLLAIPVFGPDRAESDTDFNDLARLFGIEAVRKAIDAAQPVADADHQAETAEPPQSEKEPIDEGAWPAPQAMTTRIDPEPYPLDALPDTLRAAVEEVHAFVKAPFSMVVAAALSALSLSIQQHVDVKRDEKLTGPTGLFLLTIAESGERKSTVDGFFTTAVKEYEEQQAESAKPIVKKYLTAMGAWEAKSAGVKDKIRQLAKEGKPTADSEALLYDLESNKPEKPRVPRILHEDITPEELARYTAKEWPSGGVVSAEGGIVFGSHGMGKDSAVRNLATLNKLWDGGTVIVGRKSTDSFTVKGARLTMALQVQEQTIRSFFKQTGDLARGTGFMARFLISWPDSTQGSRKFTSALKDWPALAVFNKRVSALLNIPAPIDENGELHPVMMDLSPEAKALWVEFHDEIEAELASGGDLHQVRDVASKTADNAVRLAALFQAFERGISGHIEAHYFERAANIAAWHLSESRRFLSEFALPDELAASMRLDAWLIEHCRINQTLEVSKRDARQFGPIRDGAMFDYAIKDMVDLDRIRIIKTGKKIAIRLNPGLLEATQ